MLLILPLLAVVYMRIREANTVHAPTTSVMFDRREQGDEKVVITQRIAIVDPVASSLPVAGGPTMVQSGSSLDFVKDGGFPGKPSAAAATEAAAPRRSASVSEPVESEPAPEPVAKKGGKKIFNAPKLQGTKNFSSFKAGSPRPGGAMGARGSDEQQGGNGGGGMADMLKGVPGGVNNPEVQKYLQSQGK